MNHNNGKIHQLGGHQEIMLRKNGYREKHGCGLWAKEGYSHVVDTRKTMVKVFPFIRCGFDDYIGSTSRYQQLELMLQNTQRAEDKKRKKHLSKSNDS